MNDDYDFLVFIGRFQPYHSGHHHVAMHALMKAKKLIFVIGSHNAARSVRNPLTTDERISIIKNTFDNRNVNRILFSPQVDYTYNDERWIASVQASVTAIVTNQNISNPKIGLIGYSKDHTSYYLKKFPQWDVVNINPINNVNATDVRRFFFEELWTLHGKNHPAFVDDDIHYSNLQYHLTRSGMAKEYKFVQEYKKQWANVPYPPTFQTVDAVVTQSGHALLVRRKAMPGKGLWALPGGFVNQTETLKEAVVRELYEETRIDVPRPVIIGSIVKEKTYDDPNRSDRGRTITQVFHIKLSDQEKLPKIKGSDDADKAFWVPFSTIVQNRDRFFEDHFSIIQDMIGL